MDFAAAQAMALALMERHGVLAAGWRFGWSRGKRQLGCAQVVRRRDPATGRTQTIKTIKLSTHLVALNDEPEVRETILHEIAHAIAGVEHGHGAAWRAACRRVGAKPERVAGPGVKLVAARYAIDCGCCGRVVARRHRRMDPRRLKRSWCRSCGPRSMGRLLVRDDADSITK